jgi:hypothetical protein
MTETPRHVKVTMYMPPGMLADLDVLRAELVREGLNVDRGALIRAAIQVATGCMEEWTSVLKEDTG